MIRSKFIRALVAAFYGLALQFQPSVASAQMVNLFPGQSLAPGFAMRTGNWHTLVLQFDGNLVLYNSSGVPIWSTKTFGSEPIALIMQLDGNLVLYSVSGPVWASKTSNNPGAFFTVQEDGNLVVYQYGAPAAITNYALWASGTGGQ